MRNPTAYTDIDVCDRCEVAFHEEDLTQVGRDDWLCADCLRDHIEEERQLQEMADDDKAHKMAERRAGL